MLLISRQDAKLKNRKGCNSPPSGRHAVNSAKVTNLGETGEVVIKQKNVSTSV